MYGETKPPEIKNPREAYDYLVASLRFSAVGESNWASYIERESDVDAHTHRGRSQAFDEAAIKVEEALGTWMSA